MLRHAALILGLLGGISGCKGLGGLASGLGHVAGGLARAVPKVAGEAARALPAVAKGVARETLRAVPDVIRAVDVVGAVETSPDVEVDGDSSIERSPDDLAEVDVPVDPCDACPPTRDCNQCTGFGGHACTAVETSCVSP
jgi:hypothetical protein